jgi:peptidoglycan/LPS O-acetylase OafA/YrhL
VTRTSSSTVLTAARAVRTAVRQQRDERDSGPRRDIQGLRALAVLAVVLDHLLNWPRGGFVGVDVFFVLSGFLITGLLLREHERTGAISFLGFYRRRARRILPAATLVIIVTVMASWFAFNSSRWSSTVVDATWAVLFAGNWRFAAQSTDYFQQGRPVSPLQQYWSLGVEEQFYFVWPWLLLLLFALLARRSTPVRARLVVGVVLGGLTVASYLWSAYETSAVPDRAYFSTVSRAWELGVGALLAVGAPALARLPGVVRPLLAWTGLTGIVLSLFVVNSEVAFPAPWATLPVLATALVVAAGTGVRQQRGLAVLTNDVSQYVGDISYSLYLWHFPIIIIGTTLYGESATTRAALALAVVGASVYCYHLVEDPLRRSSWLEPGRRRPRRQPGPRFSRRRRDAWLSLTVVLSVLFLAALQQSVPDRTVQAFAGTPATSTPTTADGPGGALQVEIQQALTATSYPQLEPSMEESVGAAQAPDDLLECGTMTTVDVDRCSFGPPDAARTLVVVGDSMSMTWVTTLRTALPDWRVVSMGGFGCTFTDRLIGNSVPELEKACPARKDDAVRVIGQLRPDLVVVSNTHYPRVPAGEQEPLSEAQWGQSTARLLKRFSADVGKVVLLAPPPADKDVNECYSRVSEPADCVSRVTQEWSDRAATERGIAQELGGTWVDSSPLFCAGGACPPFVGNTPVKVDVNHMTASYAKKIAPALRAELAAAGLV